MYLSLLLAALISSPAEACVAKGWVAHISWDTMKSTYWWARDGRKKYGSGPVMPTRDAAIRMACNPRMVGCKVERLVQVEYDCSPPEPVEQPRRRWRHRDGRHGERGWNN